uniref:Uncharacterized protein n=1 Tax=Coccolithus braarudii TaxID=221442 RepID=A0A7S0Q980_9EUKA
MEMNKSRALAEKQKKDLIPCFAKCLSSREHEAATAMQAIVRGKNARFQREELNRVEWFMFYMKARNFDKAKALAVTLEEFEAIADAQAPPSEEDEAAIKMQSVLRGKKTREELQEVARLEWFEYYKKTGDFDQALDMAISPDEEESVKKARQAAEAPQEVHLAATKVQARLRGHMTRTDQQEGARLEWLEYYKSMGQFELAREVCVTPDEEAEIIALELAAEKISAPKSHAGYLCNCFKTNVVSDTAK